MTYYECQNVGLNRVHRARPAARHLDRVERYTIYEWTRNRTRGYQFENRIDGLPSYIVIKTISRYVHIYIHTRGKRTIIKAFIFRYGIRAELLDKLYHSYRSHHDYHYITRAARLLIYMYKWKIKSICRWLRAFRSRLRPFSTFRTSAVRTRCCSKKYIPTRVYFPKFNGVESFYKARNLEAFCSPFSSRSLLAPCSQCIYLLLLRFLLSLAPRQQLRHFYLYSSIHTHIYIYTIYFSLALPTLILFVSICTYHWLLAILLALSFSPLPLYLALLFISFPVLPLLPPWCIRCTSADTYRLTREFPKTWRGTCHLHVKMTVVSETLPWSY